MSPFEQNLFELFSIPFKAFVFLCVFQNQLSAQSSLSVSQESRKRRTTKRLCDKRDRAITCMFWSFTKRSVKRKMTFEAKFSKKIIVTLTTQRLLFSLLSRPVASVHYQRIKLCHTSK